MNDADQILVMRLADWRNAGDPNMRVQAVDLIKTQAKRIEDLEKSTEFYRRQYERTVGCKECAESGGLSAELTRLREVDESQSLIALCPDCNATYVDHDGFGCCGCKENKLQWDLKNKEIEKLKQPPVVSIAYPDGRIKSACLPGWWITARHNKGETWVEIKATGIVQAAAAKGESDG